MGALAPRLFALEHDATSSDDYYTPRWVFERMGITFDLDVASPQGGVPWIPAERFYTVNDDGLTQPWAGRVWMNPPYSDAGPWVERFIAHANGVALVQHSRSKWHSQLWSSGAALADPNPPGQGMFQFIRDGRSVNVFMPVVLAAFGDECVDAISRLGVVRRVA